MITDLEFNSAGGEEAKEEEDLTAFESTHIVFEDKETEEAAKEFVIPFVMAMQGKPAIWFAAFIHMTKWLKYNIEKICDKHGWKELDVYKKKHSVELETEFDDNQITAFLRVNGFSYAQYTIKPKK